MENSISVFFGKVKDPRIERNKIYPLEEILLIGLSCIISGGEGFNDMVLYGKSKLKVLEKVYPFKDGIASYYTFRRIFMLLDPEVFQDCFIEWVSSIKKRKVGGIALDGKMLRGSANGGKGALSLLSAWAHEEGLVLGSKRVKDDSNEIPAIPEILDLLDIKDSVLTIDSIGCQKAIVKRIIEKGGDYVIGLKGNQEALKNSVEAVFKGEKKVCFGPTLFSKYESLEKDHGRIETRKYRAISVENMPINISDWAGIKSIIEVESTREIGEKISHEKRYYISSLKADAQNIGKYIRGHWGIENSLHWVMDVTFNEDQSRIRSGNAHQNIATIRHIALNMLKKNPRKISVRGKRLKAGWDSNFFLELLSVN